MTAIRCGACESPSCKQCSHFIDEELVETSTLLPADLIDKTFCSSCFDGGVSQQLDEFYETLRRAKDVNIYNKDQGKETRLLNRTQKPITAENCSDRDEAVLRLAFLAAQKGFNTIIDLDLKSAKVRLGGNYAKLVWNGTAVPVNVNE